MYQVDVRPRLIVPDFISRIAREVLNNQDKDEHHEFIKDLSAGLVLPEKWHLEGIDNEHLQF